MSSRDKAIDVSLLVVGVLLMWLIWSTATDWRRKAEVGQKQDEANIARIVAVDPSDWDVVLAGKPASYLNELGLVPFAVGGRYWSTAFQDGNGRLWLVVKGGPNDSITAVDGPWIREP